MPPKRRGKRAKEAEATEEPRKARKISDGSKADRLAENWGDPNQTVYVHNLNDQVHVNELKKSLYLLFSTYGDIIEVLTMRNTKMRGQAHVVFADVEDATLALKSLNGTMFFGKELKMAYANGQSHAISRLLHERPAINPPN
ncbi:U2 small nuclear ribonucleoprotein B'' [Trichomonascus vanleenenianus]|uniref:RNA-binding protein n=1 Tax=Trichomonascus vanleenenianus TaxID=2268995 RepID=UPI003ECB5B4A